MKLIHAVAAVALVAAGPALAQSRQGYTSAPPVVTGQAVQPDFAAQIQQHLKNEGYYSGPVDGVFGQRTRQSLAQWQQDQGLTPTGQINGQSIAMMNLAGTTQQAEVPERARPEPKGTVRTFREDHMTSPNVEGEPIPQEPGTGIPVPGATPEELEPSGR
ncbi:MAG: peptidoglycan-binding domain-containing protein [Solirubrobacterales bacterium]